MNIPEGLVALTSWPAALARRRPSQRERLDAYPHVSAEKLRFADTDSHGHISHTVFAVCCQNARMELLSDAQRLVLPPDALFVIARLELHFLGEMQWPGTVHIGTRVARVGRSSVALEQTLFLGDRHVALARSTVVLIDKHTRAPRALPTNVADRLAGLRSCAPSRPDTGWPLARMLPLPARQR